MPETQPAETANPTPGDSKAELRVIAQNGNQNRLSPSEEDKATRLMRECILENSEGVSAALEAMPQLPWILGVRAIESAWQTLAPELRAQVLEGLAKMETDNGYRLRLSVARGLARVELPAAVQVACGACSGMWKKETGSLSPEHSKLIGNVFIGRGKPWVLQLPLADSQDEAADAVVASVVFSAFNINNPPITQLSILRYSADRLGRLHENVLGMVARGVGRWNAKWQSSLRKEIPNLPESILAALKPERGSPAAESEAGPAPAGEEEAEAPLPPELEERFKLASESGDADAVEAATREINAWREAQRVARLEALDEDDEDEEEETEGAGEQEAAPTGDPRDRRGRRGRDRRDRPAYVSREQERGGAVAASGYSAIVKQLDAYVSGLRTELATAQSRLRRAEEDGRKGRADRPALSPGEANLSLDELRRLVIQLENRIAELQARVEELTSDSETRAMAMDAGTPDASPDPVTQLRTLLALKLQEDYADFLVLDKELPDAVVQQHYRSLIRHVFEVLQGEQIPLRVPAEPDVATPRPIPG
ncbi:MAG: hypothetical protein ABMA01_17085 [Chthoniobacteraceae bacterium]